MNNYFITHFDVKGLWGHKNYPIKFHEDVNVIIGPNASGKTTLINILYDTLTGNFPRLCRTQFTEVIVGLKAFEGSEHREVRLRQTKDSLTIQIDEKKFQIPLAPFQQFGDEPSYSDIPIEMARRHFRFDVDIRALQVALRELVPAVLICPRSLSQFL